MIRTGFEKDFPKTWPRTSPRKPGLVSQARGLRKSNFLNRVPNILYYSLAKCLMCTKRSVPEACDSIYGSEIAQSKVCDSFIEI